MTALPDVLAQEIATHLEGEAARVPELGGPVCDSELRAVERELHVVLPRSYLAFLRWYGAARVGAHDVFGLPRHRLWGDVVMMNQLPEPTQPPCYVKFSQGPRGRTHYLDTSRMNAEGECPVIRLEPAARGEVVAVNFLEFLRQARAGLL